MSGVRLGSQVHDEQGVWHPHMGILDVGVLEFGCLVLALLVVFRK